MASAKHNAAVKEIDVKNGHEFGENMRVYNEERQRISIKNNEIELARLAHVAQRNKERQASKLKSLASVEYLKVQQDMVLLCHALPCEVYLTRPQKITLNQQIVNMDQDLQRERMVRERWDTLAIKQSVGVVVVHGCSWLGTHTKPLLFLLSSLFSLLSSFFSQQVQHKKEQHYQPLVVSGGEEDDDDAEMTTAMSEVEPAQGRRLSSRKQAAQHAAQQAAMAIAKANASAAANETAMKAAMAELNREEKTLTSKRVASELILMRAAHRFGLVSQAAFVARVERCHSNMDLLQCLLEMEELAASVEGSQRFNRQQIRRQELQVHTNYVMLPLFPTPVPDQLMKAPQLSMVAARLYNLEHAFSTLFTPSFEASQLGKYYKKRKHPHTQQTSYGATKYSKRPKTMHSGEEGASGSPVHRGGHRGALTPAEFGGLLTIDGQPIEICTTCEGRNTRKNGSNRGKLQRWCVDCQKSYRVRDALTKKQHQQVSREMIDEAKVGGVGEGNC